MKLFPMTPAQSWALILFLVCGCALLTIIIKYCATAAELAMTNYPIAGVSGIAYALAGQELIEVRRERVIEVSRRRHGGYCATTTDGEQSYKYIIIPSSEDEGDEAYDEAVQLAGGNQQLLSQLLPDSRVKQHFTSTFRGEGEENEIEFFVVFLKNDSIAEVQSALERYFKTHCR